MSPGASDTGLGYLGNTRMPNPCRRAHAAIHSLVYPEPTILHDHVWTNKKPRQFPAGAIEEAHPPTIPVVGLAYRNFNKF